MTQRSCDCPTCEICAKTGGSIKYLTLLHDGLMGLRDGTDAVNIGAGVVCAARGREEEDVPPLEESDDSDGDMPPLEADGEAVRGDVPPRAGGVDDLPPLLGDSDDDMPPLEHDSD
jgi:hypothetical protein